MNDPYKVLGVDRSASDAQIIQRAGVVLAAGTCKALLPCQGLNRHPVKIRHGLFLRFAAMWKDMAVSDPHGK